MFKIIDTILNANTIIFRLLLCKNILNVTKKEILTLNILSAINSPALCAILFGCISQINNPYLLPPAKRIPILDVSAKNDIYLVTWLNYKAKIKIVQWDGRFLLITMAEQ